MPTPSRSSSTSRLGLQNYAAGHTPDNSRRCGEAMAAVLKMICSPSTVEIFPPGSASTPTARVPAKSRRQTMKFARMVRFRG